MGLRSIAAAWLVSVVPVLALTQPWTYERAAVMSCGLGGLAAIRPPRAATLPALDAPTLARAVTTQAESVATPSPPAPPPGGAVVYRGPQSRRRVALTFDDGPSPTVTPRILEVLREHGAHATFFVLGVQAERHPAALRRIVEAGHELGNHGFSHRSFRSLFPSQITDELDRTAAAIEEAGGARPRLVRPPFGRFPESSVALVAARGEDLVLWSVDGRDSERADALTIANAVVRNAEPGAIILLHDREPDTLTALPLILGGLARRDLEVVPVSTLLDGAD